MNNFFPNETEAVWAAARAISSDHPLTEVRCSPVPVPEVTGGYTRVKMTRTSLNRHDIAALGGIAAPSTFPVTLGCEGVGRLEDGSEVLIYPVVADGDTAASATNGTDNGTFAHIERAGQNATTDGCRHASGRVIIQGLMSKYAVVPTANLVPKPEGLPLNSAAVLGCAWLTAYCMLFTLSGLERGETMLVLGSSGGVATALIQMGSAAGMDVWATGRTEETRALARRLGADHVISPSDEVPVRVRAVFHLGGQTWEQAVGSVADGGSIIMCGSHGKEYPGTRTVETHSRHYTMRTGFLGSMEEFKSLVGFVMKHAIRPLIDSVVPLDGEDVSRGFERMLAREVSGKIVVAISE